MQADEVLVDEKSAGGGGREGPENDDLDEFIDIVARANNVPADAGKILPVVKASPCAMHNRHLPAKRRDFDLLYATNCHGGHVTQVKVNLTGEVPTLDGGSPRQYRCSRKDFMPKTLRGIGVGAGGGGKEGRGRKGEMGTDRLASPPRGRHQQYAAQPRMMAKLPSEMPPNDLVTTWLKHGSAPVGESHFPNITQPTNRIGAKTRPSAVSE